MIIHIFPDLESTFIAQIRKRLASLGYSEVRVAARKSESDEAQPIAQVVIGDNGGSNLNAALRDHGFRVNIWAKDWASANALAQIVEAIIPTLPTDSAGNIKYASVSTSATRVIDPTGEEMRSLSGRATMRARTQTI